jgi:hypothetical protein
MSSESSDFNEKQKDNLDLIPEDFYKILKDFIRDLLITFSEHRDNLDEDIKTVILSNNDYKNLEPNEYASLNIVFEHCKRVFPERFFDILYQNDKIFNESESIDTQFIPGFEFKKLWHSNISDKTKETIWKYLQLLLFVVVKNVNKNSSFGDTAKLFEAINEDELKEKLSETIENVHKMFSESFNQEESDEDDSKTNEDSNNNNKQNFNVEDLPDPSEIHEHITGMLDGKLGNLAKEIAAETAEDLNVNLEENATVNDVFEKLFKNPGKLMGLVQNVGSKLDKKIKSGEIKESELIQEASELMNKMKNIPGLGNIQNMMNQMNGGRGGKMNMGAFQSKMNQNLRTAKSKERMQQILKQRQEQAQRVARENIKKQANSETAPELFDPTKLEHSKFTTNTGETVEKTPINKNQAKGNKKKKKKKNK